jgi:hypothetical protein
MLTKFIVKDDRRYGVYIHRHALLRVLCKDSDNKFFSTLRGVNYNLKKRKFYRIH